MKQLSVFLCATVMLLSLSSCFEIREEITLLDDGSGRAMLVADFSESKETIASFMSRGEAQGEKLPTETEVKEKINEFKASLSAMKGISNVDVFSDYTNYNFNVSMDFSSIGNLNAAINELAKKADEGRGRAELADNFAYKNGMFQRLFAYSFEPMSQEQYDGSNFAMRLVAESARLVQIYRFAKPIKSVSNEKASLSPSRTSMRIKHKIADLLTGKSEIGATVKFDTP